MTLAAPEVTVLMSVFNAGSYLDAAIWSIRNQSFSNFEFLIINDGSTDGSGDILERHALNDPRLRVISQENRGLIAALNRGIDEARSALIARMDADDIALQDRLAKQVAYMQREPCVGLLGGHIRLMDADGATGAMIRFPVGDAEIAHHMLYGSPVAHPTAMMRRNLVQSLGGYRAFYQHCEDYDLWLRISEHARIANVDECLLNYRRHAASVSSTYSNIQTTGAFLAQAAWLMRRAGHPDPTHTWPSIDQVWLMNLPLEEREKWNLICRWIIATLENLPNEAVLEGVALVSALERMPGKPSDLGNQDMYKIHGKVARLAYHAGYFGLAIKHATKGFASAPLKAIKESVIKILWRVF